MKNQISTYINVRLFFPLYSSAMATLLYYAHKPIMLSPLLVLVFAATTVSADYTTHGHKSDHEEALKLKLIAIASVLVAGGVGVSLPLVGRRYTILRPENDIFFMIKSFAAGVILATGFIHILPEAFRTLSSPSLSRNPWGKFPFSGFIAMAASIVTLMMDTIATNFYKNAGFNEAAKQGIVAGDEEEAGPVHIHTHSHVGGAQVPPHGANMSDIVRQRIISQVLEVGIVVHSVIIGISLGASNSPDTIKPLLFALSFHQFFEGIGLGGCISQAKFEYMTRKMMSLFFSLTTPIGIGVGIGISGVYKENSVNGLIVQGVFNSASAGILIYMALVDLLAADFMNPRMQSKMRLQLGANISLLLGAGSMSFLAIWT